MWKKNKNNTVNQLLSPFKSLHLSSFPQTVPRQFEMSKTLNHAAAIKRLEALFEEAKIEEKPTPEIHIEIDKKHNTKCDVHGKNGRRGSLGNILHIGRKNSLGNSLNNRRDSSYAGYFGNTNGSMGPRRESMPALNNNSHYHYNR